MNWNLRILNECRRFSWAFLVMGSALVFVGGCSSLGATYFEKHTIGEFQIVLLDEGALHKKWTEVSGQRSSSFDLTSRSENAATLQVVTGFFEPGTNTMYCTNMDLDACGRELHHVVMTKQSQPLIARTQTN